MSDERCIVCGDVFSATTSWQKYCSQKCSRRARYIRNRDTSLERQRVYAANNREQVLESKKRYYRENKEYFIDKAKEYNKAHPDKHKEWNTNSNRRRVEENPREFRARHVTIAANVMAKKRGVAGRLTYKEWLDLCDKYGNKCLRCGRIDVKLTIDHVIPLNPGSNTIDNIQPLCGSCNSTKRRRTIDYRPDCQSAT